MSDETEDDTLHMIIQVPTETFWGTEEEFDIRIRMGEVLDRVFEQALLFGKFEVHGDPSLAVIPAERSEGRNP